MRRGLTLIELLLALSLLGTVIVAAVSWTQLVARAGPGLAAPAKWEQAAHEVLGLVHDDLLIADTKLPTRGHPAPRVRVQNEELRIDTRNAVAGPPGPVVHQYRHDPGPPGRGSGGRIELRERHGDGRWTTRVLLADVEQWDCTIDEARGVLVIRIGGREGAYVQRRFARP